MKIGIIGAGNIGGALTRRFTQLGHDVSVANSRGPETLRELEEETGIDDIDLMDDFRHEIVYFFRPPGRALVRKTVIFFLGEVQSEKVRIVAPSVDLNCRGRLSSSPMHIVPPLLGSEPCEIHS